VWATDQPMPPLKSGVGVCWWGVNECEVRWAWGSTIWRFHRINTPFVSAGQSR